MAIVPDRRTCPKCGRDLPAAAFRRDSHRPDGLACYCRDCKAAADRARRARLRERDPAIPASQRCSRCGIEKPSGDFWRNRNFASGLSPWCHPCENEARRIRRGPPKRAHYRDDAYLADGDQKRCRVCERLLPLAEFRRNGKNRDRLSHGCRECRRERAQLDAVQVRAARRRYYARNRIRVIALAKARREHWTAEQRERYRNIARDGVRRRRARRRSLPVEMYSRQQVWERDGGRCHLCGKPCDPTDWHLDHLVPIADGGADRLDNVAVAHPTCNLRRNRYGPAQLRLLP